MKIANLTSQRIQFGFLLLLLLLAACTSAQEAVENETPTPTQTDTPRPSPTAEPIQHTDTPTVIPAPTNTPLPLVPSTPMLSTFGEDLLCRFGPGEEYALSGAFLAEEVAPVLGRSQGSDWYVVEHPRIPRRYCWLRVEEVHIEGDLESIPIEPLPENIVIGVSVDLAPSILELVPCTFPATFTANYIIQTSGPLSQVTYRKVSNEGMLEWETVAFPSGVPLSFRETLEVGAEGIYFYRIEVTEPNLISGESSAEVVCP